jgi:hypothetical protein
MSLRIDDISLSGCTGEEDEQFSFDIPIPEESDGIYNVVVNSYSYKPPEIYCRRILTEKYIEPDYYEKGYYYEEDIPIWLDRYGDKIYPNEQFNHKETGYYWMSHFSIDFGSSQSSNVGRYIRETILPASATTLDNSFIQIENIDHTEDEE